MKELKDRYKSVTDEVYLLFTTFKESGFNENQAMELTSAYVRNSIFDNVISAKQEIERRRNERRSAILKEMQSQRKAQEEKERDAE